MERKIYTLKKFRIFVIRIQMSDDGTQTSDFRLF